MGRKWSLEFGKHGSEGIGKETDENLIDDVDIDDITLEGDGTEISNILKGVDTSMDDDYEDCAKNNNNNEKEVEEEENYEDCKKESIDSSLKDMVKDDDEILEYDTKEDFNEVENELNKMKENIMDIFG